MIMINERYNGNDNNNDNNDNDNNIDNNNIIINNDKDLHGTAPYMAPEMLIQAG